LKVIQDVTNQVAGNSDWPPNTHWTDRSVFYAWINMATWGLGLPLRSGGLAGLGVGWLAHLEGRLAPPFVTVHLGGRLLCLAKCPILALHALLPADLSVRHSVAAWALVEIFDRTRESRAILVANGTSAYAAIQRLAAYLEGVGPG